MSTPHSPLPWRVGPTDGIGQRGLLNIVDVNGVVVADCEAPRATGDPLRFVRPGRVDAANVAVIVRAVNNHAALLEIVKDTVARHDAGAVASGAERCVCGDCDHARQVIANVGVNHG